MRTFVYVDGFNLYYGALKDTPYKWLDLNRLCRQVLNPANQIAGIKYFTARVSARPEDPDQPTRQQTYLRALQTIPNLEIIYGHFLVNEVVLPTANPGPGEPKWSKVLKPEEKGSDVNLAVHLVNDAHKGVFEVAAIISNDSDLCEAVRIVRNERKLTVGVICPHKKPSRELLRCASFFKSIRPSALAKSQFPQTLADTHGSFHKPQSW